MFFLEDLPFSPNLMTNLAQNKRNNLDGIVSVEQVCWVFDDNLEIFSPRVASLLNENILF